MDSTSKENQFVTPKNKYTIFYYKIPVSFGSPYVPTFSVSFLKLFKYLKSVDSNQVTHKWYPLQTLPDLSYQRMIARCV